MKVLIVDDIQFMLVSLKQLLERNGYEVVAASTGKDALKFLSTDFMIDVVITDLMMPEMSGLEIYRRTQEIERFNDEGIIPPPAFLLLTSFDEPKLSSTWGAHFRDADRCFVGTLYKPVEGSVLLPLLEQLKYQGKGAGREAALLHELLQRSLDQLGETHSDGGVTAVVQQLQRELAEI